MVAHCSEIFDVIMFTSGMMPSFLHGTRSFWYLSGYFWVTHRMPRQFGNIQVIKSPPLIAAHAGLYGIRVVSMLCECDQ
jgi:hypothetical protein